MSIAKVIHKYPTSEQPRDCAYWQSRAHQERLHALEEIREEYKS